MLHEIGNLKERFAVVHHQANNLLLKSLSYSTGTHTTWIHEHTLVHEEQAQCEIVSLQGKLIIDYILSNDESLLKHHNQHPCTCDHLSRLFFVLQLPFSSSDTSTPPRVCWRMCRRVQIQCKTRFEPATVGRYQWKRWTDTGMAKEKIVQTWYYHSLP